MAFFRFMETPVGRSLRIIAGITFVGYGALSPTLLGIVALMIGVAGIVTGLARLPLAPPKPPAPRPPAPRETFR